MYIERPFWWYMVCAIWWTFVLECMNVWMSWRTFQKFPELAPRSKTRITVHAGSVSARLAFKSGPPFDPAVQQFPFCLANLFSLCFMCTCLNSTFFLFFHHDQKFISLPILIQIWCNFSCHSPYHVLDFMVIFNNIVHVWKKYLARVCLDISFCSPCSLFWSYNLDA